jgi:hypothetical protein
MPPKKKGLSERGVFTGVPSSSRQITRLVNEFGTDEQKQKVKTTLSNFPLKERQNIFRQIRDKLTNTEAGKTSYENWLKGEGIEVPKVQKITEMKGVKTTPPPKKTKAKAKPKAEGETEVEGEETETDADPTTPVVGDQRDAEVEEGGKTPQFPQQAGVEEQTGNIGLFAPPRKSNLNPKGDPINNFYFQRTGVVNAYNYRRRKMYPFLNQIRQQHMKLGLGKNMLYGDPSYLSGMAGLTPEPNARTRTEE